MASDAILFLAAPFLMCLFLVGIHCYLGLHVLARGVIFVDLALAQIAAMGTTIAYLIGFEHNEPITYFVSLGAAILAAFFLALANRLRNRLSQEAVIGVVYAFGAAAIVLLVDKMSHGAEHLKHALVGQILWVGWHDVVVVFLTYSAVALVHYLFRNKLIKSSFNGETDWKWDFLFYGLFAVVITCSVHVAGVLLVFAFLIVPALLSILLFQNLKARLFFGWALGAILSLIGMFCSYRYDLPAGSSLVLLFTFSLLLTILVLVIKDFLQPHRPSQDLL